jgi:hypothetical protein
MQRAKGLKKIAFPARIIDLGENFGKRAKAAFLNDPSDLVVSQEQ